MTNKQAKTPRARLVKARTTYGQTKVCCECSEPIRIEAKKCKTCGEYQDNRRFLAFSSTFLALLVALVSVISLSIPIVSQVFDAKDSQVNVLYQGAQNDKAYFLITNSGTRDGTVSYVRLVLSNKIKDYGEENRVVLRFEVPPVTISGGKSQQIIVNLSGKARAEIDKLIYETWLNNASKQKVNLPELQFRVGHTSFRKGELEENTFSPFLNDLLLSGPTDWYKCAGSIAWSDWYGPGSHFYPQDIDPGVVEAFCGKLPATFNNKPRNPIKSPRPDASYL